MMRKIFACFMLVALLSSTCGYRGYVRWFRPKIEIAELIKAKEEIDSTTNPAKKYLIESNLRDELVGIKSAVVKEVLPSNNIDYNFCVVVEIPYEKGYVECYLYSKNVYEKEDIATLARLQKGKTIINAVGEFNRFFTLLDDAFVKIELINTAITIVGEK
ncbi:MAG: hypothetical protein N2316_03685 [Spirochaetes bacterium]|nr:hypothetical protein [Spirochaetota bacterium]